MLGVFVLVTISFMPERAIGSQTLHFENRHNGTPCEGCAGEHDSKTLFPPELSYQTKCEHGTRRAKDRDRDHEEYFLRYSLTIRMVRFQSLLHVIFCLSRSDI
jgi:hypothetical protein